MSTLALAALIVLASICVYDWLRIADFRLKLKEAQKHLDDARRLKSEFIAKVSHELKTPLNSAVGYIDLLCENRYGQITSEQNDILKRVHGACHRLLALIQNLLDFSGADLGKIEADIADFDLNSELRSTLEMVGKLAESKGVRVTGSFDPAVGKIHSDRQKIHQAIANLLANSVKFTEKGQIDLRSERMAGEELILIEVRDTGIGIPREALSYVFEEFRQADGSIKRTYGGQGLGLSIAQKFVHFLGGDVAIESEEGKGTMVRVIIPTFIDHPMRREEERETARQALERFKSKA